jgi:hypothetical protein
MKIGAGVQPILRLTLRNSGGFKVCITDERNLFYLLLFFQIKEDHINFSIYLLPFSSKTLHFLSLPKNLTTETYKNTNLVLLSP